MPANEKERRHIAELIEAHQEHLRGLEVTKAKMGLGAPTHIAIEIDRCEKEIAQLKQAAAITISDELAQDLGVIGRYQLMQSHIMRLDTDIGRLSDKIDKLYDLVNELLLKLAERGISSTKGRRKPQ